MRVCINAYEMCSILDHLEDSVFFILNSIILIKFEDIRFGSRSNLIGGMTGVLYLQLWNV